MKLSAPKEFTFWIAVALAVLGLIAKLLPAPYQWGIGGWLVVFGFLVLAAGVLFHDF